MSRRDPYLAFCFRVTIQSPTIDDTTGLFKSVSGLSFETEVVDFKEGGVNDMTHKLVGGTKFKNIVLKRGFSGNELADWWKSWQTTGAKPGRASGTIEQLDTKGGVKAAWQFVGGWPCKYEVSEFDASKNEVTIETLEIAHQGLTKTK